MTYMSPLLQNRLNATNTTKQSNPVVVNTNLNQHDKVYEDLRRRANEVRPNEAKAKLVKENFATSVVSTFKDTGKDIANFNTAVKTGKMNDTRLGRINDLGMKFGAAVIAAFLALHSKTKTEAIMKFIGGGAFLASMSLWPKLFINAPAKAKHGFDIGQKYISAQGDKKDFFLDNQFLPWDAYSKEEIEEIGKKMGIDANSKNGHEKIQRKMQKTALQNRTLWMATAGFATPIMSALISNRLEPHVKNAVIKSGVAKSKKVFADTQALDNFLANVKPDIRNQEEIERLANIYKNKEPDEYFYKRMPKLLSVEDVYGEFLNPDDAKLFEKNSTSRVRKTLEALREACRSDEINPSKIKGVIEQLEYTDTDNFVAGMKTKLQQVELDEILDAISEESTKRDLVKVLKEKEIAPEKIKEIVSQVVVDNQVQYNPENITAVIKNVVGVSDKKIPQHIVEQITREVSKEPTMENLEKVLKQYNISEIPVEIKKQLFDEDLTKFYNAIVEYNKTDLAISRARLKKYVQALNPLVGSKEEALATQIYDSNMTKIFKELGIDYKKAKEISQSKNGDIVKVLSEIFKTKVQDEAQYENFIKSIAGDSFTPEQMKLIETAMADDNIAKIKHSTILGSISDTIFGKKGVGKRVDGGNIVSSGQATLKKGTILGAIKESITNKLAEVQASKLKAVLCANFERRLKLGEFADWTADEVKAARNMIYDSTMSLRANGGYMTNAVFKDGALLDTISPRLFDSSKFATEKAIFPEITKFVDDLKEVRFVNEASKHAQLPNARKYILSSGLTEAVKKHATKLYNSKTWLKTFAPIAAGIAGVTLLAQFAFGKIDKEYPEDKKGGVK